MSFKNVDESFHSNWNRNQTIFTLKVNFSWLVPAVFHKKCSVRLQGLAVLSLTGGSGQRSNLAGLSAPHVNIRTLFTPADRAAHVPSFICFSEVMCHTTFSISVCVLSSVQSASISSLTTETQRGQTGCYSDLAPVSNSSVLLASHSVFSLGSFWMITIQTTNCRFDLFHQNRWRKRWAGRKRRAEQLFSIRFPFRFNQASLFLPTFPSEDGWFVCLSRQLPSRPGPHRQKIDCDIFVFLKSVAWLKRFYMYWLQKGSNLEWRDLKIQTKIIQKKKKKQAIL